MDSVLVLAGEAPELLELDVPLDRSLCPLRTRGPVRRVGLNFLYFPHLIPSSNIFYALPQIVTVIGHYS